nr:hypothetical protein [Falsiroseomonas bella]
MIETAPSQERRNAERSQSGAEQGEGCWFEDKEDAMALKEGAVPVRPWIKGHGAEVADRLHHRPSQNTDDEVASDQWTTTVARASSTLKSRVYIDAIAVSATKIGDAGLVKIYQKKTLAERQIEIGAINSCPLHASRVVLEPGGAIAAKSETDKRCGVAARRGSNSHRRDICDRSRKLKERDIECIATIPCGEMNGAATNLLRRPAEYIAAKTEFDATRLKVREVVAGCIEAVSSSQDKLWCN